MVDVITIDGPSGVGKSTVAKMLAQRLNYRHLDTGAMYRAISFEVIERGVSSDDPQAMAELTRALKVEFIEENGEPKIFCDGRDVSVKIRTPEVSRMTSQVADVVDVRRQMVAHQRKIGLERPCVAEGRDMGTVVFPDAMVKFFIEGSVEERTARRHREQQVCGSDQSFEEVKVDIDRRDRRDRSRPYGALRVAEGAIVVDTTELSADQVVSLMHAIVCQQHAIKES